MFAGQHLCHLADKFRIGAAASAEYTNAKGKIFLHTAGKLLSGDRIKVCLRVRKPCVCLDKNRQRGAGNQFFCKREQFHWSQRTVKADKVSTQSLNNGSHGRHAASGEGASICLKGHRNHERQRSAQFFTGFLCSKDAGLYLIKVGHGFQHDKICSGSNACGDFLGKDVVSFLKRECTSRFQQLPNWSDVQRNQCLCC